MSGEATEKPSRAYSWYPGHMLKAQKRMAGELKHIDVVLEIRDARLPLRSGNPELERLIGDRKRLLLLNKAALADPALNRRWAERLEQDGLPVLLLDAESRSGLNLILPPLKRLTAAGTANFRQRGIRPPPVRLMVVGMPNVGKSTFINRIVRKSRLKTAPTPGVTRGATWVPLKEDYLLMDTPGVMLPRIANEQDALLLACIGALPDSILGVEKTASFLIGLISELPLGIGQILSAYGLENVPASDHEALWSALCEKRGFILPGRKPDRQRAAETLLNDFRKGALGRYTFETPEKSL